LKLARRTHHELSVSTLHEPTKAVDVGTKSDVSHHLTTLAKQGAVLMISSVEYKDVAHLCTRFHVIVDGRAVRTSERGQLKAHDLAVAVYAQ
jgi:ABC-type sugar transport system ATPase subunit